MLATASCGARAGPSHFADEAGGRDADEHAAQRCEYSTTGRPEAWQRLSVHDAVGRAIDLPNQYVLVSGFLAHDGMLLCASMDAKEPECLGVDPWTELHVGPRPIAEACGHARVSVIGTLEPPVTRTIPQSDMVKTFPATVVVTRLIREALP